MTDKRIFHSKDNIPNLRRHKLCHRIKCFRVVSHLRGKVAPRSWLYYYPHVTGEQCESWRSNLPEVTVLELGRTGVRTQICLLRERIWLTMMGHTLRTHLVTTPEAPSPGYSHSAFVPGTSFLLLFPPKHNIFKVCCPRGSTAACGYSNVHLRTGFPLYQRQFKCSVVACA